MRVRHAFFRENLRSLLRFWLVLPTLMTLGCAASPDLLPVGAPEFVQRDVMRRVVGIADFPVVVSPMENEKKIEIRWTWNGAFLGKWYWWRYASVPFATARQAIFTLSVPGMKDKPLCRSGLITNKGQTNQSFDCEFDVAKYFGRPLVGWIEYSFEEPAGDGKMSKDSSSSEEEDSFVSARTYYMIKQPIPVAPPSK